MRLRQRFCSVPNPLVCAIAREKVHLRNMHSEVISHLDKTNEGNKRKFGAKKEEDSLALQRKRQRNDGWSEALCHFQLKKEDDKIPSWSALLFDNAVPLKRWKSAIVEKNSDVIPIICQERGGNLGFS